MTTAASNLWIVFRREVGAYFNVAIAYIFITVFVVLNGLLFMGQFFLIGRADMRSFFASLPMVLAVFLPAVTMRLWAEERKGNTLELLLTFPMAPHELVLGKFLASFLFYGVALSGTLTISIMLQTVGHPDTGAILTAYLGALFLGAFYLAIGIFISGLVRDQIVAFVLTLMICLSLQLVGSELVASSIDGWLPGLGSWLRNFVGTSRRFDSFERGVIDNTDIFYFLLGTAIFLVLNGFWMEGRARPRARLLFGAASLFLCAIFLMCNYLFAGISLGRFDLTEGKSYTISPASKFVLRKLKAPLIAKLYISPVEKMPTGMKRLEQDIVDKLDEFSRISRGYFQYKIFHLETSHAARGVQKDKELSVEQQLSLRGVQPFQVKSIETDEVGVRLVYASLSLAYKEKPEEMIPRIYPGNLAELEYLVASRVYRMTLVEVPRVALVAPFEDRRVRPEVAAMISQMGMQIPQGYRKDDYGLLPLALVQSGYEVVRIKFDKKEPIPPKTKTLVILEPKKLSPRQKYEIDRFLRRGGAVFLAVQNYECQYMMESQKLKIVAASKHPHVNALLRHWGLEVDKDFLVDKQHDVLVIQAGQPFGPYRFSLPVKVPIQVYVAQTGMNREVSITSRLSSIFYLWGTALKIDGDKIKKQGLKVTTLLDSTKDSWTVPFESEIFAEESLDPKPESRRGPFPLAVMVQGQFSDTYKGRKKPRWPALQGPPQEEIRLKPPKKKDKTKLAAKPGKLVLVGAVTMFRKNMIRDGGHLNFFLNVIDALSLGDELITIRSKQPVDRTMGRLEPAQKMLWRIFVTTLVPALVIAFGVMRVLLRRRKKWLYMKGFPAPKRRELQAL